ncbi:M20/M25/M40 family metallo-hydrolase [Novosphingobium sp. Chol11]|uniref:M20/M25/M40 family metallo-hydrolase n=1 Tax=Novosphingobium sp. Chol11 TaxID=1385763 RepID=UPI0025FB59D3|nr:M20/M25/M40 family metallo-hydrolase [Novosphingobium sp. Chol11]
MSKMIPALLALLAGIGLAIMATTPPLPRPAQSPANVFAAGRAMADIRVIAAKPHPGTSPEDAAVRAHLMRRLRAMGLETRESPVAGGAEAMAIFARWTGQTPAPLALHNVIGVLPGKDRTLPAVALMAHHDTVWGSPGAADDTTGVAALLDVVRAVKAGGTPPRDLIVLITDGEELGLDGARHFFTADPLHRRIGALINVEARGGGGRTTLFETSSDNGAAIALAAGAVRGPAGSSLAVFIYKVLPNDTDLSMALALPYTAYNYAFIGRPWLYHSPKATPDALDQGSLQDMGGQVLDLTRALLGARQLPGKAPDVVFFDAFGLTLVVYPAWAGWIMLALAAAGLKFAGRANWRAAAGGAGRMLALMVLAGVLLTAMNQLSLAPGAPNYYDRLAAIPRLEVMALASSVVAFLLTMAAWRPNPAAMAGAALPLLVLGVAGQVLAPTAAYVVVLPVMLAAGAIAAARGTGIAGQGLAVLVAALVAGYMLALGHQVMQGVGPNLPVVAVLPLALAGLAALPLWPSINRKHALVAAAVLLALAAGTAINVRLDPLADTVAVYSNDK